MTKQLGIGMSLAAVCSLTACVVSEDPDEEDEPYVDEVDTATYELGGEEELEDLELLGEVVDALAATRSPVVLVHGNGGNPGHWNTTVNYLKSRGYTDNEILRPAWGTSCLLCNDHCGSELAPVKSALQTAFSRTTTGKIDVIGHSMGVTVAAKSIMDLGYASKVDAFLGIAGGFRGLNSCRGVFTSACGSSCGLLPGGSFVNSIANKRFGGRQKAFYSTNDTVICAGIGGCYIGGVHTSIPQVNDGSTNYSSLGHMALKDNTASAQYNFILAQ